MADYPMRDLQEEFLNSINKGQETFIEGFRTWIDTTQSVTPRVPSVPMTLPFADQLPKPEEAIDIIFSFLERWLASQRQFSEELVRVVAPLMPGDDGRQEREQRQEQEQEQGRGQQKAEAR